MRGMKGDAYCRVNVAYSALLDCNWCVRKGLFVVGGGLANFSVRFCLVLRGLVIPMLEVLVNGGFLGLGVLLPHGHHSSSFFGRFPVHDVVEGCVSGVVFGLEGDGRHGCSCRGFFMGTRVEVEVGEKSIRVARDEERVVRCVGRRGRVNWQKGVQWNPEGSGPNGRAGNYLGGPCSLQRFPARNRGASLDEC
jgi:hypothetical protein